MMEPIPFEEPRSGHRWDLSIPGIPPHLVVSLESLPGDKLLVRYHWPADQEWPLEPTRTVAALTFLDPKGTDSSSDFFQLTFERFEILPLQLDYRSAKPMLPGLLLSGVKVRRLP